MTVTHAKTSGVANDPAEPGKVGGEDWDAAHVVSLAVGDIPAGIARITVAADDPGAVGAGHLWLTLTGSLSIRNAGDDGWVVILNTD